jgi:hypothetical protein
MFKNEIKKKYKEKKRKRKIKNLIDHINSKKDDSYPQFFNM